MNWQDYEAIEFDSVLKSITPEEREAWKRAEQLRDDLNRARLEGETDEDTYFRTETP